MAMKQSPKKSTAGEYVAAATLEATAPQDVDVPRRCAIGDVQSMKGMLDDYVLHLLEVKYAVIKLTHVSGYIIDHRYSNLRLSLGALAVLSAIVAQFYPHPMRPMPFPESKQLLVVCVSIYCAVQIFLFYFSANVEKSCISLVRRPVLLRNGKKDLKTMLMRVETTLERNSLDYNIRVAENKSGKERIAHKFLINQFFTRAGTFRDDIFEQQFDDFFAAQALKKMD